MKYHALSEKKGLGKVVICKGCADVHLAVESISMRITQEAFVALGEMIQEALRHPKLRMAQKNPKEFMAKQLFSLA